MSEKNLYLMSWAQWFSLVLMVAAFYFSFQGEMYSLKSRIKKESIRQAERTDKLNARTDQLYQMFIDLLKSNQSHEK